MAVDFIIYDDEGEPSYEYADTCNGRGLKYGISWWPIILDRWCYVCAYCRMRPLYSVDFQGRSVKREFLEVEHMNPTCLSPSGPDNSFWNVVPACPRCNRCKGARTPGQWLSEPEFNRFDRHFSTICSLTPQWITGLPNSCYPEGGRRG